MMNRILIGVLVLIVGGCSGKGPGRSAGLRGEEGSVAGLRWSYPETWSKQHDLPMRVATYVLPPAEEDTEAGECAVFYFGADQGGGVDMNIQRWGSQFEGATEAVKTTTEVNGIPVTIARIEGTYLAPAGPMMESQGKKEGYKLLAAIVEGPQGMVFFKCTGPAKTIDENESGFLALVESIRKDEGRGDS